MEGLDSLALIVGTAECNAACRHCAGIPLRSYAPKNDGDIDEELIRRTVRRCYDAGARKLAINGSGEPTLSPLTITRLFELLKEMENEGIRFQSIHLYTNGIRIGEDEQFCNRYLKLWKDYGLDTIYVTVHDIDEKRNAAIYRTKKYPPLSLVFSRIHDTGMKVRANLVLSKDTIHTLERFICTVKYLSAIGVDTISAWPVRGMDDRLDEKAAPPKEELDMMEQWIKGNMGYSVRLLRENNRIVYTTGQKLTLFPDGRLTNSWCNNST